MKLTYDMPLAEILYDFFDKLKSRTRGYASMEYEFLEYRPSDLVKLDILVGGNRLTPFRALFIQTSPIGEGDRWLRD